MQPNLKATNIISLNLSTTCILPQNVIDIIQKQSPPINGISHFVDIYVFNRTSHTCLLFIQEKNKEKRQFTLEFDYRLIPKTKIPKNIPKISNVISDLCSINDNLEFSCSINIGFKKREKRHFLINLPIKFSESPNMPFKFIDGFSFSGEIESVSYNSLVVVNDKGDESWLVLRFSKKYILDRSLAQNLIDDAMSVAYILMPKSG